MRILVIVIPLLLFAHTSNAQASDERPFRFHMDIGFGLPSTNFKAGKNDNYIVGQATDGWGFGLKASKPVWGNLYVGLGYRLMYYNLQRDTLRSQTHELYDNNQLYTNVDVQILGLFLNYLGAQVSWVYNTRFAKIEPFIEAGIVLAGFDGDNRILTSRKRQNSNYTDSVNVYYISPKTPSAAYTMFGVRLNKKVATRLNISLAASYTATGSMEFYFMPELTDYYGNKQELTRFSQQNRFKAFQFETGVQFRFWRSKNVSPI